MRARFTRSWVLILAGGDGERLRPLTRRFAGDDRPKQFCPLLDGETLLDRTRRRADLLVRPDRQVVVVTESHAAWYRPLLADLLPGRLVVQPRNRNTGPGILYPLLRVQELAGDVPLAVMPSDHDVSDDALFMRHVADAVDASGEREDRVVLLGVEPATAETDYGWIEPDPSGLPGDGATLYAIRRFWEKPDPALAQTLLERGCLWNSFVMAGRVSAFLSLFRLAVPDLVEAFAPLRRAAGTAVEAAAAAAVYAALAPVNFSARVLAGRPERLAVLRVKDVEWNDLGHPSRVMASLGRRGRRLAPGA
jgi:mannose-1-phosphate guanylyltransferase